MAALKNTSGHNYRYRLWKEKATSERIRNRKKATSVAKVAPFAKFFFKVDAFALFTFRKISHIQREMPLTKATLLPVKHTTTTIPYLLAALKVTNLSLNNDRNLEPQTWLAI